MITTTTRRVHHADGSCTDIIVRRHESQGIFGTNVHEDIQRVHHTREELEAQAEAGLTAAGILVAGGLLYAGFKALFGNDKK